MTNIISATNGAVDRPRLCRSNHQPNMLEYIDTTLNESFPLNLTLNRTISNGYDQFGNTILDQYLLYLLCQKIKPNKFNNSTNDLYQLLHQLIIFNGKISKAFFEYSPSASNRSFYQAIFNSYTNFIWNEFDVSVLLELGCFLLKYRLRDIFTTTVNTGNDKSNNNFIRQKMTGYFLEIIAIYYLSSSHHDFFTSSRSVDMIFPSPSFYALSSNFNYQNSQTWKDDEKEIFKKFLNALHDNGEIHFDMHQLKILFQSDIYQFLNKKMENKKIGFMNFFEKNVSYQQQNRCRSLKSICRLNIKMHIKQYPTDIKQLPLFPSINDQLQKFLTYENKFAFQSYV